MRRSDIQPIVHRAPLVAALALGVTVLSSAALAQATRRRAASGAGITISVGVATEVPVNGQSPGALVRRADANLYQAKNGGRNLVRSDAHPDTGERLSDSSQ